MSRRTPISLLALLTATAFALAAGPAQGATTLGGSLAGNSAVQLCPTSCSLLQATLPAPVGSRVAGASGVITRWRAVGAGTAHIFVADLNLTTAVGTQVAASEDVALALTAPVNSTRIPVAAGQFVGITANPGASVNYTGAVGGARAIAWEPALAPGLPSPAKVASVDSSIAYEAVLEPDADKDGFGDETQDKCKAEATPKLPGGPCAPPGFTAKPKVKTVTQGTASKAKFILTEAASLKAKVEQKTTGRKVGKTCKKATRGNAKRKKCTRYVARKRFNGTAIAGSNTVSLGKYKAGSYRLTIVATDKNGAAAKPVTANFKVKAKPKKRQR